MLQMKLFNEFVYNGWLMALSAHDRLFSYEPNSKAIQIQGINSFWVDFP